MQFHYEAIEQSVKIFTQTVELFPYHWHEETEILFILKGSIEISIDKQGKILNVGDIFLVNKNEIHFTRSLDKHEQAQLLILQFNLDQFKKFGLEPYGMRFSLDSGASDPATERDYNQIRYLLASMMKVVVNREEPTRLLIERHLLELFIILTTRFRISDDQSVAQRREGDERLLEILKYINANYKDPRLSLNQIAERFYLTPQYLSKYFTQHMGISLKKFVENIRLNKSLKPLRQVEHTIIDVALQHGFPDAKSYYRVFREVLGMTPSKFRELQQEEPSELSSKDYFSINSKETLTELFKYLNYGDDRATSSMKERSELIKVHAGLSKGKLRRSWTRLMTFGYAPHGLRYDFQEQLKTLQRDIGFEYVRFHGIFADELLLYNETPSGEPYYNFNHIDMLLDSLLAQGVRPFLELGFMPTALASGSGSIFWWEANVTPPKQLDKWLAMLKAFVRHLINRYGISEVSRWYFEFWNEPEIEGVFWHGTKDQFFQLFKASFEMMKSIDPRLKVGGFGNINFYTGDPWVQSFIAFARQHRLVLDFYSFHVYQLTVENKREDADSKMQSLMQSLNLNDVNPVELMKTLPGVRLGDENVIPRAVKSIIDETSEIPLSGREYWITEWNANTDCRDLIHDTCYMAAFIVRTALLCGPYVEGMGYWTATDLHEEFRLPQSLFHGGFGLLTYNGIKKAGFHALAFLAKLGEEIVLQQEGIIVTRRGDDYQILLYQYCHYNELYSHFDYSQISPKSRYGIFQERNAKRINIQLDGLIGGTYTMDQMRVNRHQGSSYDAWVAMGAPDELSVEGKSHLQRMSEPSFRTWKEEVVGSIQLEVDLEPHEIQLILLRKQF